MDPMKVDVQHVSGSNSNPNCTWTNFGVVMGAADLCGMCAIFSHWRKSRSLRQSEKNEKIAFLLLSLPWHSEAFWWFFFQTRIPCTFPAWHFPWTSGSARAIQSWVKTHKIEWLPLAPRMCCQFSLRIRLFDFSQCTSPNGFACEILRIISQFASVEHFNENAEHKYARTVRREPGENAIATLHGNEQSKNGRL